MLKMRGQVGLHSLEVAEACLPMRSLPPGTARIRFIDPANVSLVSLWAGFKHRLFSRRYDLRGYAKGEIPFVVLPYHDGSTSLSDGVAVPTQCRRDLLEAAVEAAGAGVNERTFVYDSDCCTWR